MSKKRLIKIAIEQLKDKENVKELNEKIRGEPALIFTNENPFKLSSLLSKEKSSAPAKTGQIAPNDIIIPSGPTNFTPGPIIGELGQLGIKTEVKEGKISIKEDKLLVKENEIINQKAADILSKLGIEPMQVSLNLIAAYEKGIVYTRDILSVDEEAYLNNLRQLGRDAFNLAIYIGYATKDTINYLIKKAFREANTLADSRDILTSESIKKDLAKVEREAKVLSEKLNIGIKEIKKEGKIEEKRGIKVEAKKEVKEETKEAIEIKKRDDREVKETKKLTTEELLKEAEEETREEREKLQKEKREKEEMKKAEEKLKELTDKAIKEKKR